MIKAIIETKGERFTLKVDKPYKVVIPDVDIYSKIAFNIDGWDIDLDIGYRNPMTQHIIEIEEIEEGENAPSKKIHFIVKKVFDDKIEKEYEYIGKNIKYRTGDFHDIIIQRELNEYKYVKI